MAEDVGTTRIPVTGLDRHGADFATPMFAYQLKVRNRIPDWIFDWLGGICGTARAGQVGVLVLKQPGKPRTEAVVCVRWADWVALHGVPQVEDESSAFPVATETP